MPSRRRFVRDLGTVGLTAAISPGVVGAEAPAPASASQSTQQHALTGTWQFRLDPDDVGRQQSWFTPDSDRANWDAVEVPHTWQVEADTTDYHGVAWYHRSFRAPDDWAEQCARLEFEAVYHSATIWVNGERVGEHLRKGYTAFAFDISNLLRPGETNTVVVRVDNAFSDRMLPRGTSYDWAEDGGITRPVNLLVTPPVYADRLAIDARPNLDQNTAEATISCRLHNTTDAKRGVTLRSRIVEEDTGRWVVGSPVETSVFIPAGGTRQVDLPQMSWSDPQLWHFDHPHLHHAVLDVCPDEGPAHRETDHFGVRSITVSNEHFYLNGEQVSLMGVERMAGSHPTHGMAEPEDWIEHNHDDMKVLNCIFTRVHWPQDRRVLDYCDRHGILIQTEVPAWGPDTFNDMSGDPDDVLLQNGLEQLREMIHRDRNHPSIISWGLCNETDGTHPPSYRFTHRLYDEAKRLNPNRLCSYASNTLQDDPSADKATETVDFIMWNEYYESWYGGTLEDADENLVRIHEAFPDKPIVVSEYGYCECTPDRMAGDEERIQILKEHTAKYRKHDFVGGAIFFSYNDYRTHIGDKGVGAIKQRVHGVVDLFGRQKPSFQALRRHSSPVKSVTISRANDELTATIQARSTIPAYPMHDYILRWVVYGFGDLPMEQHEVYLPSLAPGDETNVEITFNTYEPGRLKLDVLRSNGHSAYTDDWTL